jgi:hypothetical protein
MKTNELARWHAGISVETIVGAGIAILTLGLFTLAMVSGNGEKAADIARANRLSAPPHDAASFVGQDRTNGPTDLAVANTIVRNGLTVVTPPLLVPFVDLNALQTSETSADGAAWKRSSRIKRSHYARRGHTPTVVTAPRIVGLAASRRLLTAAP